MKSKTEAFLSLFEKVRETPSGWVARCPAHEDKDPSLSISEGREGIVLNCFACCSYEQICAAVGWQVYELFWENSRNGYAAYPSLNRERVFASAASKADLRPVGALSGSPEGPNPNPKRNAPERLSAEHFYVGEVPVKVRRMIRDNPNKPKGYEKNCYPYRQINGEWVMGLEGYQPPLYNLESIEEADPSVPIVWVEGESCVDALSELGILATTSFGGTSHKLPDLSPLEGRRICVIPDRDPIGEGYAEHVYHALKEAGAARVWIFRDWPDVEEMWAGYDVVDWLESHSAKDLPPLLEPPPHKASYKIMGIRELLAQEPLSWQVEQVIQEGSLWLLFGESANGKSFIGMDLLLNLCVGTAWCGREIRRPGPTLFINADGGGGFRDRVAAWFIANNLPPDDREFYTLNESVPIWDAKAIDKLKADIEALGIAPAAIVIDTYSRCIAGKDENNQGESSQTIKNMDDLRQEYPGCSIGCVHHTDASGRRVRGSSVLIGAVDTAWRITKDRENIAMTCEKQRNGRDDLEGYRFRLRPVPGTDQAAIYQEGNADNMMERMRQENTVLMFISDNPDSTSHEISERLGVARQRVSDILNSLARQNLIQRGNPREMDGRGRPPVTYQVRQN